jgi:3' terminal RNA ribose 2'-O-methyltransferase Hen1
MLRPDPDSLDDDRHAAVLDILCASGARSVLDLGCGGGFLLARMLRHAQFRHIVGVERSASALAQARGLYETEHDARDRLTLINGSFTDMNEQLSGFDAAVMVETIEHVDPSRLSAVEQTVFGCYRPRLAVVTTPNAEYNVLYGMGPGDLRDPDHRFEWSRARFMAWARGIAQRRGYRVRFGGIGEVHPIIGHETQMALFRLRPDSPTGAGG